MGKVLFKGNEALAEAALAAGCRFYSGYPITPQTEILEYLAWRMEDVGGVFIQAESELAGVDTIPAAFAADGIGVNFFFSHNFIFLSINTSGDCSLFCFLTVPVNQHCQCGSHQT